MVDVHHFLKYLNLRQYRAPTHFHLNIDFWTPLKPVIDFLFDSKINSNDQNGFSWRSGYSLKYFFFNFRFFSIFKIFNYFIRIIINGNYLESDMLNHATSKSESNTALHIQRQYIQAFQAAQSQQVIIPFRFLTQFVSAVSVGGDWSLRIFLKIRQVYLQIIYFGHFIF